MRSIELLHEYLIHNELVSICTFYIIFVVFGLTLPISYIWGIVFILILTAFLRIKIMIFICAGVLLAVIRINVLGSQIEQEISDFNYEKTEFWGVIYDEPEYKKDSVRINLRQCLDDDISSCNISDYLVSIKTNRYPIKKIGQICFVKGDITNVSNFSDEFDYETYMKSKKVLWNVNNPQIDCKDSEIKWWYIGLKAKTVLYEFRIEIERIIEQNLLEPNASLLIGMIFGSDRVFDDQFTQELKVSGTMHIIAASGYNVAVVSEIVDKIIFFCNKKLRRGCSIFFIIIFCLLSGMGASVVRAGIMSILTHICKICGAFARKGNILIYTCFIMIFANPYIIKNIGFQLSVSATAFLILGGPVTEAVLSKKNTRATGKIIKMFHKIINSLMPGLITLFATAPIFIIHFGQISIAGLISNIFISPFIDYIIFAGIAYIILRMSFIKIYLIGILNVMTSVIKIFGSIDAFLINIESDFWGYLILTLFTLFILLNYRKTAKYYSIRGYKETRISSHYE